MRFLLLFSGSMFAAGFLPVMPPMWLLLSMATFLIGMLFLPFITRSIRLSVLAILVGFGWGVIYLSTLHHALLPDDMDGAWFSVEGDVVGLPERNDQRIRFRLQADRVVKVGGDQESLFKPPLNQLLISWYDTSQTVEPGDRWRLLVKLKRPRGMVNPGGFDYQGWLFARQISATGYVRPGPGNERLSAGWQWPHSWRMKLKLRIEQLPGSELTRGLLLALVLGDSSAMSASQWQLLNLTGTTHLLVISGLHIGLFAAICFGVGCGVGRMVNQVLPRLPAQTVGLFASLAGALLYASITGMGLPAQRALIMLLVIVAVQLSKSRVRPMTGLAVALAAVAVIDPLAVHGAGFWLSFGAVAALLWVMVPLRGRQNWLVKWWRPQWVVFVALFVLLLGFFGQLPLSAPLINTLAIPWVSLLIVPLALLGVVMFPLSDVASQWLWQFTALQLEWLWVGLEWMQGALSASLFQLPVPRSWPVMVSLSLVALTVLLPRGLPGRWLAIVPVLVLLVAEPQRALLQLTVLDVGQGLSVVVTTTNHTLVYDVGATFSDRFSIGSGVVAPYLRHRGIRKVDTLLVSHGDSDHAGGALPLLKSVSVDAILLGESVAELENYARTAKITSIKRCERGQQWQWDGVEFEVLSPDVGFERRSHSSNNQSCVLLIRYQGQQLLIPGDIEADVERELVAGRRITGDLDLLVAPHHGSKSSSTVTFVSQYRPHRVIYSAGFRHHFGHPHPVVAERYRSVGAKQWNTAQAGAITATFADGQWQLKGERYRYRYFWQK